MRGHLVTIAFQGDFGKPRPALVVQSDFFENHPSVTVLPVTSDLRDTPLFRVLVEPSQENGLRVTSQIMIDKAMTVSTERLGEPIGRLDPNVLLEVDRCLAVFLGIVK
ncbi:MAG: type II toxin-antitoxin system PemK/MazF family toxin [Sulfuritalea sp.]|nr:type II toxin-antitoxin system PemK/MazF family toxin [Polynucleobacter sp.]MCF8187356.1 type II toxin-antitoxin system PemK/MazF family toxin [Sulfuritalea sp.]